MKNLLFVLFIFFFIIENTTGSTNKPVHPETGTGKIDSIIHHVQKIQHSVCVLKNNTSLIPIIELGKNQIVSLSIDSCNTVSPFQQMLKKYSHIKCIAINSDSISDKAEHLNLQLDKQDILIVSLHSISVKDQSYISQLLSQFNNHRNTILSLFGSPQLLDILPAIDNASSLLYTDDNTPKKQEVAAQIIFGGISASGVLSASSEKFRKGLGIKTGKAIRFQYTIPEMAGVDSKTLHQVIDSVATLGIDSNAFPGCQILVAKDRKVIYHQCFGFHTYAGLQPVHPDAIYDLASITKITGPLPALMRFVDEGKIQLDDKFASYWKDFRRSNKKDLIFRDVLAHQAQLVPWIPFWRKTIDHNQNFKKGMFSYRKTRKYPVQVAPQMFLNRKFKKKIFRAITESELLPEKEYKYSGLSYFIFPEIIQNISGRSYPEFIKQEFYKPLGANTTDFNVYKNFPTSRIIPTEYDNYFRNTLLHGFVDDEGCAMLGGVSGNAGLFSSANDLAKVMQMYLQMGAYGGKRYLSEETVKEFTQIQFPENNNRRGLGFDKPLLGNDTLSIEESYPAYSASPESFGHSGFTGTFTWADPENKLLFIFLSNRIHPTRKSRQIYEKNIRIAIHQGIYDAIEKFNEKYNKKK